MCVYLCIWTYFFIRNTICTGHKFKKIGRPLPYSCPVYMSQRACHLHLPNTLTNIFCSVCRCNLINIQLILKHTIASSACNFFLKIHITFVVCKVQISCWWHQIILRNVSGTNTMFSPQVVEEWIAFRSFRTHRDAMGQTLRVARLF